MATNSSTTRRELNSQPASSSWAGPVPTPISEASATAKTSSRVTANKTQLLLAQGRPEQEVAQLSPLLLSVACVLQLVA